MDFVCCHLLQLVWHFTDVSRQWSRLLERTNLTPGGSSRKDAARDPARRLHRFEKEYGQILVSLPSSHSCMEFN